MASTYSTSNRFDKQGTGDNPSTWGTRLNERVFDMVDESLDGVLTLDISSVTSYTLTTNQGTTDQARKRTLVISGTATAAATVTVPALNKWYLVKCSYTGDYVTTIKTASDAGVGLMAGDSAILYVTPSGVFEVFKLSGLLQAGNNLSELTDTDVAAQNLGYGSVTVNTFTNNGSTTVRTLTQSAGSSHNLFVCFDGLVKTPGIDYTVAGATLTYTTAPANGTKELIFIGNLALPAGEPSDGSVTEAKIADGAVTANKLADGAVTANKLAAGASLPSGAVMSFAMGTPPTGWLECNGAAISRTTYANLFAVIGTTWGSGDGSTTFNIPDFRGEFLRGWDNGRGVDLSRTFGSYQADAFQGHRHSIPPGVNSGADGGVLKSNTGSYTAYTNTYPVTDGINGTPRTASETRPRNIAVLYCIKT